jgi:UDP-N-acetylmuramate dehydrogenase
MIVEEYKPLQPLNTFGIAARSRYYSYVPDLAALEHVLSLPTIQSVPTLVLGRGSNVLFTEDFEGLVVQIGLQGIEKIREEADHVWLRVGAGVDWHSLVVYCVNQGYSGIENLSLIPGTVGAAPIQNIGAYGVEFSQVFESLEAWELRSHTIQSFFHADCAFGYRQSVFKQALQGQYIILNVVVKLNKKHTFQIGYDSIQAVLEARGVKTLTPYAISEAIIQIRQQKLPDPEVMGSAGSFFENPVIDQQRATYLHQQYPGLPLHSLASNQFKIPAAWLIEQCGWKGYRNGNVGVSPHHALVLVHYGNASGKELHTLASLIQESVWERFNIHLVPEVNIIARYGIINGVKDS